MGIPPFPTGEMGGGGEVAQNLLWLLRSCGKINKMPWVMQLGSLFPKHAPSNCRQSNCIVGNVEKKGK